MPPAFRPDPFHEPRRRAPHHTDRPREKHVAAPQPRGGLPWKEDGDVLRAILDELRE